MSVQQVLIMTTTGPTLRSPADGWTAEDPSLLQPGHIGNTPGMREPYTYETPMHALAAGWHLLAPPTLFKQYLYDENDRRKLTPGWEWWFTRARG
jgi:hypothetical protein